MADQIADNEAIRRFIAGFYAAFSFREGGQPNWDALRGLFWPGGSVIEFKNNEPATSTPAEFLARLRSRIAHGEVLGIQERETDSAIRVDGDLAQVFSHCETRAMAGVGGAATTRGVNAFLLIRHAGRWLCLSVCRAETAAAPPPPVHRVMPAPAPRPPFRPGGGSRR